MGNINDMAGIGMEIEKAKAWVGSKGTATAAGSAQGDAGALGLEGLIRVSGGDGTKGVILNANLPTDSSQIVVNAAGSVLKLYPPSGGAINGLSADAAWTIGDNQAAIIVRDADGTWAAVGSPAT